MRVALKLAAAAALLSLAACGFAPLYATGGTAALSRIDVQTQNTRAGQLLRENLKDALAITPDSKPLYRLNTVILEQRYPRGIRVDDTAFRYEEQFRVTFTLVDLATNRVVFQPPAVEVLATYDVADQPFAGIVAQQDGQARAAFQAAQLIRTDLARFFATREGFEGAGPATAPVANPPPPTIPAPRPAGQ